MFKYVAAVFAMTAILTAGLPASAKGKVGAPASKSAALTKDKAEKKQVPSRGLFLTLLAPLAGKAIGYVAGSVFENTFMNSNDSAVPPEAFFGNVSFKERSNGSIIFSGKAAEEVHGGLAFEVLIADGEGALRAVDPAAHGFVTGDKFNVRFMSNLPGQVAAYNVNSEGRETHLGAWTVAQGQSVQLPVSGSFQFQGQSGNEQLKLVLTPCETSTQSRDIVVAAAGPDVGGLLGKCGTPAVATREITEVGVTENTGFALSPVTDDEKKRQRLDARTVSLNFLHRRPDAKDDTKHWLVTPEEATQAAGAPSRDMITAMSDPGGPKVEIRSPGKVTEVKLPVNIEVTFQSQGQTQVDLNSLKVTYVGLFDLDITDRLLPYLTKDGIKAEDADLPVGKHVIDIAVRDKEGRRTVERLSFKVLN
ncbi:MAG: hypothetical protein HQL45_04555 [Alphaproteobacteria bacterium]|nr:hypothetical protein [Alphaproteobacteria bacterium]